MTQSQTSGSLEAVAATRKCTCAGCNKNCAGHNCEICCGRNCSGEDEVTSSPIQAPNASHPPFNVVSGMERSIVGQNLMTVHGYSPYCGNIRCNGSMPRTKWDGKQFKCLHCSWRSKFSDTFISEYKAKWHLA